MNSDTFCNLCNKQYFNIYSLRRHVQKFHPEKYNEEAGQKEFDKITCKQCSKSFVKYGHYKKHVLNRHNEKDNEVAAQSVSVQEVFDKVTCKECSKSFTKYGYYKKHVLNTHNGNEVAAHSVSIQEDNEVAAESVSVQKVFDKITCKECSKSFAKYGYYKKHVFNRHNDKKATLLSGDIPRYSCPICEKLFSSIVDFQSHKVEKHGVKQHRTVLKKICPLCQYEDESRSQLISHFQSVHDLNIVSETKCFLSFEEFMEWKTNIEKTTSSLYMNKFKDQINFNNRKQITYRCHRSGHFQSTSIGIKHLKSQGSVKINGYCPSEISLNICDQNKYEVLWTKSHVGHEGELAHLRLTAEERSNIAAKIAAQIPFTAILDGIRDSATICELERIHLLTKRDLYNIQKAYNLNTDVRHENDAISVETLLAKKEEVTAKFLKYIDSVDNVEEMEVIMKTIAPLSPKLRAMKSQYKENNIIGNTIVTTGPSIRIKIEPQRRLKKNTNDC